jgi:hypothetical protein
MESHLFMDDDLIKSNKANIRPLAKQIAFLARHCGHYSPHQQSTGLINCHDLFNGGQSMNVRPKIEVLNKVTSL